MNQRFQSAEIKLVNEQYADNELYKAVNTIGTKLESELREFGLCPEECFMEALEVLSVIAEKGESVIPELEDIWLRKENEYRRYDRSVNDDEIRKAVGIVLGFVILAIDSSTHPFYRRTLTEEITLLIANHKFEGWAKTLCQIASVPLTDGWFDAYIDEKHDEGNRPTCNPLASEEANALFEKARKAGLVDEEYRPKVSSQYKASILASIMGELLGLSPLWSPFEEFWDIKNLTNKFSQAKGKKYYPDVYKEYKRVLV